MGLGAYTHPYWHERYGSGKSPDSCRACISHVESILAALHALAARPRRRNPMIPPMIESLTKRVNQRDVEDALEEAPLLKYAKIDTEDQEEEDARVFKRHKSIPFDPEDWEEDWVFIDNDTNEEGKRPLCSSRCERAASYKKRK
jgi:hypothetical protein